MKISGLKLHQWICALALAYVFATGLAHISVAALPKPLSSFERTEKMVRDCGVPGGVIYETREAQLQCVFEFGPDAEVNTIKYGMLKEFFKMYGASGPRRVAANICNARFSLDLAANLLLPEFQHCGVQALLTGEPS